MDLVKPVANPKGAAMFNFEPFTSNVPGQTRGHLKGEDGKLLAFYAMSADVDPALGAYTRIAAEVFYPDETGRFRYSASMLWARGIAPSIKDESLEDAKVHAPLPIFKELAA